MKKSIFKRTVVSLLLSGLMTSVSHASVSTFKYSDYDYNDNGSSLSQNIIVQDNLPDMGTSAGATLSIAQELQMGDFYVRQMRAATPLINDPLLEKYINKLGMRLASKAYSVKTPFHFYIVNNNELNAFAFFGGNVVLHSGLFAATDNESQLASVMAHEISHVTQRHLARAMEDQKKNAPLTWVGALGSVLLATASPQAGMAALSSTIAGTQQGMVSFTQGNEQEADRIGIQVLERAGFDPQAMPLFLGKLADQSRSATKPPEMLLTHPLPDSRLADVRNRANQMSPHPCPPSLEFMLAKVRVLAMYTEKDPTAAGEYIQKLSAGGKQEVMAAKYGKAIMDYQDKKYANASDTIQALLTSSPNNPWFLDLSTDIDLAQLKSSQAVSRLEASNAESADNAALRLNLANAEIEAGQYAKAKKILQAYTYAEPDDVNGWEMLEKVSAKSGARDSELAARAERKALNGEFDQAIELLSGASALEKSGSLEQARHDARIDQLIELKKTFKQYK